MQENSVKYPDKEVNGTGEKKNSKKSRTSARPTYLLCKITVENTLENLHLDEADDAELGTHRWHSTTTDS